MFCPVLLTRLILCGCTSPQLGGNPKDRISGGTAQNHDFVYLTKSYMTFFFMRDFSVHTALHAMCNFLSLSQLIFTSISEKYYTIWGKIIALHAILRICSCRCENKETDQLHGEHAADQRFYFPFIERIVSVLPVLESSYSHFHHL